MRSSTDTPSEYKVLEVSLSLPLWNVARSSWYLAFFSKLRHLLYGGRRFSDRSETCDTVESGESESSIHLGENDIVLRNAVAPNLGSVHKKWRIGSFR